MELEWIEAERGCDTYLIKQMESFLGIASIHQYRTDDWLKLQLGWTSEEEENVDCNETTWQMECLFKIIGFGREELS